MSIKFRSLIIIHYRKYIAKLFLWKELKLFDYKNKSWIVLINFTNICFENYENLSYRGRTSYRGRISFEKIIRKLVKALETNLKEVKELWKSINISIKMLE